MCYISIVMKLKLVNSHNIVFKKIFEKQNMRGNQEVGDTGYIAYSIQC